MPPENCFQRSTPRDRSRRGSLLLSIPMAKRPCWIEGLPLVSNPHEAIPGIKHDCHCTQLWTTRQPAIPVRASDRGGARIWRSAGQSMFCRVRRPFSATAADLWCRYPRRVDELPPPSLRRRKLLAKAVSVTAKLLSTVGLTRYPLQVIRIEGEQVCDVGSEEFAASGEERSSPARFRLAVSQRAAVGKARVCRSRALSARRESSRACRSAGRIGSCASRT